MGDTFADNGLGETENNSDLLKKDEIFSFDYSEDELIGFRFLEDIENLDIKLECFNHIIEHVKDKKDVYFLQALSLIQEFETEKREEIMFALINSYINYDNHIFVRTQAELLFMESFVRPLNNPAYRYVCYARMSNYAIGIDDLINENPEVLVLMNRYSDLSTQQLQTLTNDDLGLAFKLFIEISQKTHSHQDWHDTYGLTKKFKSLELRLEAYWQFEQIVKEQMSITGDEDRWSYYPTEIQIHYINR